MKEFKINPLSVVVLTFESMLMVLALSDVHAKRPAHGINEEWGWELPIAIFFMVVLPTLIAYICGRIDSKGER